MCLESQTFYRCACPPRPPITISCTTRCGAIERKVRDWVREMCAKCTDNYHQLLWLSACWSNRFTGGTPPGQPTSSETLLTVQWLRNSGAGAQMKQQIATMERDIIAQGTTKRRMLTIGEMLNPEDQPPLVQRSVQPSPCEGKPAAEEKDKRHTNMAVRVSKEKRQRTQGPRKHVSKPYVVHRMRV